MERVNISEPLLHPSFIGSWMINSPLLCENLINYFESNISQQKKGVTGSGVDTEKKDTVDISITRKEIILRGY